MFNDIFHPADIHNFFCNIFRNLNYNYIHISIVNNRCFAVRSVAIVFFAHKECIFPRLLEFRQFNVYFAVCVIFYTVKLFAAFIFQNEFKLAVLQFAVRSILRCFFIFFQRLIHVELIRNLIWRFIKFLLFYADGQNTIVCNTAAMNGRFVAADNQITAERIVHYLQGLQDCRIIGIRCQSKKSVGIDNLAFLIVLNLIRNNLAIFIIVESVTFP